MADRGAVCGKAACTVLRGAENNFAMDEILWHRWGNQAANRENKLHPIGRGGSGLLKK